MTQRSGGFECGAAVRMKPTAGESPALALEPVSVLPVQLETRCAVLQPEKRLMLAVLESAIATFLRSPGHARGRRESREVEHWVQSPDTSSPFTFLRVCEALGLDAEFLRTGLARARRAARDGDRHAPILPLRRMAGVRHRIGGPVRANRRRGAEPASR